MRISIVVAALSVGAACVYADDPDPRNVVLFDIDRPVMEPGEFATITISAGFDSDTNWAMGAFITDFVTSRGPQDISSFGGMIPWDASGTAIGVICDTGVCGLRAFMLQFPALGIYAVPTDPIAAWTIDYRAPDVDEPLEIAIHTETSRFRVYTERESADNVEYADSVVEGRATILVVPCRADFDLDGELTIFDFLAFQNAFVAGDAMADFDFDGELTLFDFLAFQNRFDQGC